GYILTGYQRIVYAAQMGATVINCSWGGSGGSQAEQDIINIVTKQGSLVVAAAGNNASDAFYSPAAYKNVLAVAATDSGDFKASFSNYGDFVDVCAPGVNINSTIFYTPQPTSGTKTYTYTDTFSGTSMATPMVTGLIGLVKSTAAFRNYTALQLGEQVRVTCDNISDNTSGFYAGKLGRGRINARSALTITNLPSVRMQSFTITDSPGGNGNGVPQPAETLSIKCSFRNFLAPTSPGARVELTSLNSYVRVISGAFPLGVINTLDSANNNAAPFRVHVDPAVPASYTALMQVTVIDGSFTDSQTFSFLVNPTYQTTNINAIQLTLTNNGRLGFFDFPQNTLGMGLIFNGVNHLFEGGLLIGTSSSKVVNVVRNANQGQDNDFASSNFYSLTTPGAISQQDGFTTFTDAGASPPDQIGAQVNMYSYAFSKPEDSKYIILRYDIKNTTSTALTNLYAGIFLDWDIGVANANFSRYDASRSLGYAYDSGTGARREYVGVRALDSAASYRSLDRDLADLTRAGKWSWISGGFGNTDMGPTDVHHVISSGPYTLNAGATQTIGFAMLVGDSSLANIQTNADAAKAKWVALRKANFLPVSVSEEGNDLPRVFGLSQNYPNPFNPTTSFELQVAGYEFVSLKVYDLLGREVATLLNERKSPGTYKITWDASHLPSGVYLYRMTAGSFVETKKLVLMK
ncbi:MAG: S8 family peptidase, partial [Ignavibacteriales bacterium]|nr:S8 family peptidase [Ignavibacteriales bacterium]